MKIIMSEEKKKQIERASFKVVRTQAVERIIVTTASGRVFDGDEASQGRMARVILGLHGHPDATTVKWVLHDNTMVDVEVSELREALRLSSLNQTELWVQA